MIQIYSLKDKPATKQEVELGLYHHGLLFLARERNWGHGNYIQLTPETARELADALRSWADDEEDM